MQLKLQVTLESEAKLRNFNYFNYKLHAIANFVFQLAL